MKLYFVVQLLILGLYVSYTNSLFSIDNRIDGMFLKMTGLKRLYGECREAATMIQKVILDNFGIPVTIGIGENPFLSKFTLDNYAKKEGIAECRYEHVPDMVWPVPIESCWGIGEATALKLRSMGIRLMGQLAKAPLHLLRKKFGIIGEQLY
ncbi:DNA polymerase IV [compost metagenome]